MYITFVRRWLYTRSETNYNTLIHRYASCITENMPTSSLADLQCRVVGRRTRPNPQYYNFLLSTALFVKDFKSCSLVLYCGRPDTNSQRSTFRAMQSLHVRQAKPNPPLLRSRIEDKVPRLVLETAVTVVGVKIV